MKGETEYRYYDDLSKAEIKLLGKKGFNVSLFVIYTISWK